MREPSASEFYMRRSDAASFSSLIKVRQPLQLFSLSTQVLLPRLFGFIAPRVAVAVSDPWPQRLRRQLQGPLQSRSEPSMGKHIPAFSTLPDWVSDLQYKSHFSVERQKAIQEHLSRSKLYKAVQTAYSCAEEGAAKHAAESAKTSPTEEDANDIVFFTKTAKFCTQFRDAEASGEPDTQLMSATSLAMNDTSPFDAAQHPGRTSHDVIGLTSDHSTVNPVPPPGSLSPATEPATEPATQSYPRFRPFQRFRQQSRIVESMGTEMGFDKTFLGWSRVPEKHELGFSVGGAGGFFRGYSSRDTGVTALGTGLGPLGISTVTSANNEEISVGIGTQRYGMFLDRSVPARSTGLGFVSPNLEAGTLADFSDHQYGQRIRFRNFEVALRHDFDELEHPDATEYSTEFLIGYNQTGLMLVSDLSEKAYGVGVTIRGHQVSALHDFDDRVSRIAATSRSRFQFSIEGNLPDAKSDAMSAAIGIGLPGALIVNAGAGITSDGRPEATLEFKRANDARFSVSVSNSGRSSVIQYAVNLDRSSYTRRAVLDPEKLQFPHILGLHPSHISNLLRNILTPR